jgi:NAD(P)-dependent dehydrogenase (short-subunit alcohol dehydrogenase family)
MAGETGRLAGKKAIIVGAGQTDGETIGNGRAMALLFAREGAEVMCVDNRIESAQETVDLVMGRIDILVNNVGTGRGDAPPHAIEEAEWDRIMDINLKSMVATIRHVLPIMRVQRGGAIVNISSLAAIAGHHMVTYEVSKMAVNRLTTVTALNGAKYGVRCNVVMPGLMDTPMAIGGISAARGVDPVALRAERSERVPMGHMGTGWDTAYAALFLCSDEARFITGVALPVDGGMAARVG